MSWAGVNNTTLGLLPVSSLMLFYFHLLTADRWRLM